MCLALGIDDPIAWLDSKDKEVIDGWEAYFRVEPWGLEWHQNAMVCQMLDGVLGSVLASLGVEHNYADATQFMPAGYVGKSDKPKRPKQTPDQMAAMAERIFSRAK